MKQHLEQLIESLLVGEEEPTVEPQKIPSDVEVVQLSSQQAEELSNILKDLGENPAGVISTEDSALPEGVRKEKVYSVAIPKSVLKLVMTYYELGKEGSNWYFDAHNILKDAFQGDEQDRTLFTVLLASTSVQNEVYPNFIEAATMFNAIKKDIKERPELLQQFAGDQELGGRFLEHPKYAELALLQSTKEIKQTYLGAKFGNVRRILALYLDRGLDPAYVEQQIVDSFTKRMEVRFVNRNDPLLRAMKIANYALTILNPNIATTKENPFNVVVDTWMIRAFFPKADKELQKKLLEDEDVYMAISKHVSTLAAKVGIRPHQMQAAIWLGLRKSTEGVGSTDYLDSARKIIKNFAAVGKDMKEESTDLLGVIKSLDVTIAASIIQQHRADWMRKVVRPAGYNKKDAERRLQAAAMIPPKGTKNVVA